MPLRLAIALLLSPLPAAAEGFFALELPGSQLTALADDGRSAAGSLAGGASGGFRWQRGRGAQTLPHAVSVQAISPSGRYVAGSSLDESANEVATWWDADGSAHRLDILARELGSPSVGRAIGDAGEFSGSARDHDDRRVAFSWSAAGGLRTFESAPVSAPAEDAPEAFAKCPGAADASTDLPTPLEFAAASRDGAVRVGHAGSSGQRRAIVWTAQGGTQRLDAFLAAHGVDVPRDWTLVAATAIDPQARRIGGYGLRRHRFDSFIAELPASVRILCDSSPPTAASQRRTSTDQSIPSQEITP